MKFCIQIWVAMSENDPVRRIEQLLHENTKKLSQAPSYDKQLKRRNSIDVGSLAIQPRLLQRDLSLPWQYKDRISRVTDFSLLPEIKKIKRDDDSNNDKIIDIEALSDEDTGESSSLKLMLNSEKNESHFVKSKSQPCLSSNRQVHNASFLTKNTEKSK